jgi:hypothetical protein
MPTAIGSRVLRYVSLCKLLGFRRAELEAFTENRRSVRQKPKRSPVYIGDAVKSPRSCPVHSYL